VRHKKSRTRSARVEKSKARGFTPDELGTFLAVPRDRIEAWCRKRNILTQPSIGFEQAREIARYFLEARADEQRNEAVLGVLGVIRATRAADRMEKIIELQEAAHTELRELESLTGSAEWTTVLHLRALATTDTHINDLALHKVAVALTNKDHGPGTPESRGGRPRKKDVDLSPDGALKRKQRAKKKDSRPQ
jgi:hypothetical protein